MPTNGSKKLIFLSGGRAECQECPGSYLSKVVVSNVLACRTYALRFRAEGQTVVHSSDTAYCEPLIDFAYNADILIHDSQMIASVRDRWKGPENIDIWPILQKGHTTPAEAARIARLADVHKLVLVHLPSGVDPDKIKMECKTEFDGEVVVGEDLMTIECI
jgi:ribonuclease Z